MNELQVQIEIKDGINVVNSRIIAEQLGKEHSKVKRTLKTLIEQTPNVASDIFISQYNDRGRMLEEYLLTKDGFTLYMFNIQGYNDFKMAYINKFNEMEKQLKENQLQLTKKQELQLKLFSNDSIEVVNAHKMLVKMEVEEATKPLIETIETNKPLVDFAETIASNVDSIEIGLFAKLLKDENINMGRNKLFEYLRDNGYLMKSNTPYQKYIDNKYFEVIEYSYKTPYGDKLATKTLITGKGQIKLLEKLRRSEI